MFESKAKAIFQMLGLSVKQEMMADISRTPRRKQSVLTFCFIFIALILFVSCASQSNNNTPTSNPDVVAASTTLSNFCNALVKRDNQTILSLTAASFRNHYNLVIFETVIYQFVFGQAHTSNITNCTVGEVTVSGDGKTARGTVVYMSGKNSVLHADYPLIKENNVWRVEVQNEKVSN